MGQKPHVKERDEAVQSCRVRKNSPIKRKEENKGLWHVIKSLKEEERLTADGGASKRGRNCEPRACCPKKASKAKVPKKPLLSGN